PDEDWHGTDTFTYTASDGELESAAATVTITVKPVNDAPVANDDFYTTDEDTVLTVTAPGVLANDYDVDGDNLTVTLKTDVSHGTLILNGDGSFVYTPDENWYGTDSFVYNLISYPNINAEGWTDEATVTITVKPVNDAPVAVDDEYSTAYETALNIAAPGVLANDTDVENSALTATLVAGPANGTVTLNTDGSFTYTPAAGFSGTDSFTYTANDGELDSNIATVSIVVAASTNNPPIAVNDTYTIAFGTTLTVTVPGVLGNDTDADNDPLTAIKVSDPLHGTLTFNADGSFTYVPDATFSGIDTFTYKANDGENDSNVATVSILVEAFVNTPPVAQDQSVTTPEDTATAITLTATDADNDTLTYWIVGQPQHGTLTLAGNVATYTPDQDYNGSDSFTFKANDGTIDSNIATVSITVTPVNDDPVAQDLQVTTPEDTPIDITLIGTDVDGDTLTYEIVDVPLNGTVTLVGNVATYTPDEDYNGTDSFTYKVNDGELESNLATVTITVTPVNDAPVAVDDAYTTVEDTLLTVDAPGVLDNDYDVDGDDMTVTLRTNVSHGTLILLSDGSFTYQPDQDFFGTDSFTYTLLTHPHITSGWTDWATVTITVTPVNDAPVLDEIADATIPEMVEYTFTATATDVDSTDLTFSLIDAPEGAAIDAATGVFTWTPTEAQGPAEYTFTVKVCDDGEPVLCDEQSVTLTVQEVNLAPELDPIEDQEVEVGDELTFTATATDPDLPAQTLLFYLSGAPAGASIDASTGVFNWTPVASQIGEHSFEVCVTDGDLADCQEITVTVLQGFVNTAPVAVADAYEVEYEGVLEVQAPGVLENDSDVDGDPLIALLVSTTSNGTLTFNQDGSFTYVPRAWFSGTDTFTYKANDGELDSNIVTVTITVHPLPVSYFYFPLIFK
ncbi:MAG: Ig-like domain-containing protein, partial [Anaerolineaceae bacterium]